MEETLWCVLVLGCPMAMNRFFGHGNAAAVFVPVELFRAQKARKPEDHFHASWFQENFFNGFGSGAPGAKIGAWFRYATAEMQWHPTM